MTAPDASSRVPLTALRHHLHRYWREWRGYVLFFCLVWVPLRSTVIDYNPVPTGSMNPTILEGDVVWVNKLAYSLRVPLTTTHVLRWAEPQPGDIVVVLSPADGTRLVKRIVAGPGDTIALHGNRLELNGQTLHYAPSATDHRSEIAAAWREEAAFAVEDLAGHSHAVMGLPHRFGPQRDFGPVRVPSGHYFLMGDSRDNSHDSRAFGFAARDDILGKAEGVLVSWDINDTYLPRWSRWLTALN